MENLSEAARLYGIREDIIKRIEEIGMVDKDVRDITREDVDWEFKRFTFRQRNKLWNFFEHHREKLKREEKQRADLCTHTTHHNKKDFTRFREQNRHPVQQVA